MNRKILIGVLMVIVVLSLSIWMSCDKNIKSPVEPVEQEGTVLNKNNPAIRAVMAVQDRHTADF